MKKTIVPRIGPSIVPMPPMTTLKMTNTVKSEMLNEACGAMRSFCRVTSAPATPSSGADPRKHRIRARVMLTPTEAALSSLSRIAVRPMPMRERNSRYVAARAIIATAKDSQ